MNDSRRTFSSNTVTEPPLIRSILLGVALVFLVLFLFVPLAAVFYEALRKGIGVYLAAITDPYALSAIRLTLLSVACAVPLNMLFGIAAAWAIAKFEIRGKSGLITLIDLPFAVSPVIAGLIYVLLFGAQGWLGPWLAAGWGRGWRRTISKSSSPSPASSSPPCSSPCRSSLANSFR